MKYLESTLKALVSAPTVSGRFEDNEKALDFIESFIESRGMHVTRFAFDEYGALVATTKPGNKKPKVMLAAHLDVVDAKPEQFSLRSENDRYYGRGVLDMKGAIAAYLQLIDDIKDDIEHYDLGLMITTDEESGGMYGTEKLVEHGYIPEVCVLPDGGDNWQVQLYSKGFIYAKMTAKGVTAHGSRPWLGDSAILRLVSAAKEIQDIFPEPEPDTSTLNVGLISGGVATNQIPEHAEAMLDIRVATEEDRESILAKIKEVCADNGISFEISINGNVAEFSLDNPFIKHFVSIVEKVTGVEVVGSRTLGSSDARYFAQHNVPCISFYPTGGGHHGPEEWISEQGLLDMYKIIAEFVETTARRP